MSCDVQVEIKRTIPKGSLQSKDFKTKKIFVGGIPSTVTEGNFVFILCSFEQTFCTSWMLLLFAAHSLWSFTYWSDEFKNFFSKYGEVVDHQIIRDHATNRPRGFGFIIFDSEQVVDDLLANGNMIELAGSQVSLSQPYMKDMALKAILVCPLSCTVFCFILVYVQHRILYSYYS